MACTEWKAMLIDHLAGELSEEDAVLLEQHLAECRACRREAEAMNHLYKSATAERVAVGDRGLEDRLVAALRREHAPAPRRSWWALFAALRQPIPSQAMVVVACVCLVAGFWFGRLEPEVGLAPTGTEQAMLIPQAAGEDSLAQRAVSAVESKLALVSGGVEGLLQGPAFVATYSDAIRFPGSVWRDSL